MRTNYFLDRPSRLAFGLAGVVLGIAACGGGSNPSGDGSGGGTHTSSSSSSTTSSSSSSSSSTTSSSSSSGAMSCTEITAADFAKYQADGTQGIYVGAPSPSLGSATVDDQMTLEFYGPDFGAFDGDKTGTFDLTMDGDDNYGTCSRCIRVLEDADPDNGPARQYFQKSGSLVVDAVSDQLHGKVHATLTDLTLVEVSVDDMSVSTPVANGACLHLASATITIDPPPVPSGWTCDPTYYGDGACDCGCGALDTDCAGSAATDCDDNDCVGGKPNATQNWLCDPVPAGWLCDPTMYGDGTCDCGCNLQDSDCASGAASECTNDGCAMGAVDGMNWLCSGVPAAWTCGQSYYGDGYCDCACGALDDMDCTDGTVGSCDYCDDLGACGASDCSNVDASNNAVCTP